ncbi:hypothetical protein CVIRNUC_004768 [Coccomyxa viridis]|uniref:1-alkyl-2-acetylglycerophosphocholine esterase n=1 Tax=Coccomyxa viridis TaxID=1274662 RepID=A0AAV1I2P2_9CHLO|nr:hypothetical protein CVIRNUC_004768 [Coccomyxa viridis]
MTYVPSGHYSVGVCDLELYSGERSQTIVCAEKHLVGRIFYPCSRDVTAGGSFKKAAWLPSWEYAKGYGSFLTTWGKPGMVKTMLRPVITLASYWLGHQALADNFLGAPLVDGSEQHPVVLFSHGISGIRTSYSGICTELSSAGFVVLAVEHADGTAAAVRLAGGAGHKYYTGWLSEAERMDQTRYRMRELVTAHGLLATMGEGRLLQGLSLGSGLDARSAFAGRLQMGCVALMGHSYGGASVAGLTAEDGRFACGIALDPWWGALLPGQAALESWATSSPLLVLGSQTWNTPDAKGRIFCNGDKQDMVFASAAGSAGAVHLVLEDSGHDSFCDIVQLVAIRYGRAMGYLKSFRQRKSVKELHPSLALPLIANASLAFLKRHLALTASQQALIDESLEANSRRLVAAERALDAAAGSKDEETPANAAESPSAGGPASSVAGQDAGAVAAAELAGAEERALAASEGAAQGLQARQSLPGGEPGAHGNHHSPRGSGAQHMSSRAREEQEGLAQLCRGHVQQLKVYGFR